MCQKWKAKISKILQAEEFTASFEETKQYASSLTDLIKEAIAVKKLLKLEQPKLSSILPYRYIWEEKGLFINQHSIGYGLEITVFGGADSKLADSIADLLRYRVDDETDLQFVLWASNQVGELIEHGYQKQLERKGIFSDFAKAAIDYYQDAARGGFKNKRDWPLTLRDYRLFVFVSKKVNGYSDKIAEQLCLERESLTIELETAGIAHRKLAGDQFLSLLRSWVNPDPDNIKTVNDYQEQNTVLNEQIVDKEQELLVNEDHLLFNETATITNLSIKTLPDEFRLWQTPDSFFNVFRASQAIRCPFLISMHIRLIPQLKAKNDAQRNFLSMSKKARSVYAKFFSGTEEAAEEWREIRDNLAADSMRIANTFFNLMLFSKQEDTKRDESSAISCFRHNGIELYNARYVQLQSFLATMPFIMSEGLYQDLLLSNRFKKLSTQNIANLLPLVADYKLDREGLLLSSFRNQICFFNPFSDNLPTANYNLAVAATSGAGKSFLIQNLLSYVLSTGGRCFVIDLGHSYRKFCEMVGGTYLEYGSLKLNPFANVRDIKESSEQIRDLLSVLATPSGNLDDVQEEYLRQAVVDAWENKRSSTKIDDVIESLEETNVDRKDQRLKDLITLLRKYDTSGPYASVFNEYSALSSLSSKPVQGNLANLLVLELGELENKPDLLKAVLFALILNIENEIYQSPRDQSKMVVIDEAWRLLTGDNQAAARFIEKGYRTARRHLGSFVTITQSIEDFQASNEAKACWNCSDIKVIMLQNAKAFDDFMLEHDNYFDEYTVNLIKQFKEARTNGFSEFMLQLGQLQSFNRLFVDPFSRVMFSSSGKDFGAVQKYQAQGFSLAESISKVAAESYGF